MIQWIPPQGSKIALVGEAPGRDEVNKRTNPTGRPFIGTEGRYLNRLMKAAGVDRELIYITNVIHSVPPKGVFKLAHSATRKGGIAQLKADLEAWKPNVIIALGAAALEALTGRTNIEKNRGAVMPCTLVPGMKVIGTFHPGFLIRGNGKFEPIVIHDFQKALKESESPAIWDRERSVEIVKDISDAKALFYEYAKYDKPLACDIETNGAALMTSYGFATSRSRAFTVTRECLKNVEVLKALSVFCNGNAPKIFHNGLFDVFHGAYYWKLHTRNFFYDTMIAQHAVMPMLPKSLGFCASIYTNLASWKNEGKDVFKDIAAGRFNDWDNFYMYNAKDCCATFEIYEELEKNIDYYNVRPTFDLMMNLCHVFLRGMLAGIKVDMQKVKAFADENERVIAVLEHIKEETIGPLNVRSPKQKKELLYGEWKLPVQKNKGSISTNKYCIEKLERYPTPYRPHLGLINTLMDYTKRRDFYRITLDPDGRVRTSLKVHGAYTGRVSSAASITGSGANLQNQPKRVRGFYVPDPGKIFIQMDLSQAEARVVAALCKDDFWLRQFDEMDLHSWVASQLYDIPMEKVRKKVERQVAKRVSHATHYLLGWTLLSKILKCSAKEAKQHKAKYLQARPTLQGWHDRIRETIDRDHAIRTPYGRLIQFPGPINDDTYRAATAAEPQSTSSDYLNTALCKMYNEGPEDFEFHWPVHDSILWSVPDNADAITRNVQAMQAFTEVTIDVHGVPLVIPCDFEIGYDWLHMTELDSTDKKDVETALDKACAVKESL
jgi:uracil-DNA glycosylase family 4